MREAASKNGYPPQMVLCIHHSLYNEYIEEADIGCLPYAKYKVQSL